ncbi:MAG: IMP dehydrogenase [Ardenticatenaceae bacterium]|nr:IMP dehydrogenase [Ardenticatenaceae bacterium]MCB9004605.1 IMP dehydrogenase [Ardenticatenaceae bacterium]
MNDKFSKLALTFDDVLLVPGYSDVLPAEVDLRTRLAGDLYLNLPVLSAAMDTVTEAQMAISLARQGGIGVLHRNMSPEAQAEEVDKVKRSEAGMIVDPITLRPDNTLADAEMIMSRYHISGVPITDDDDRLVGILTNRDTRFVEPGPQLIRDFMTSKNLVTAQVGTTLEEAKAILHRHRIEKLPLVDGNGRLKGLITVKDIMKKLDFPQASTDEQGRLLCAAALGVGEKGLARLEHLVKAGVDAIVIDTAHGHTATVLQTLREAHGRYPNLPIIAGNAASAAGASDMIAAGAAAIKVGVGAGSICTTRIISGAGVPQITAVMEAADVCRKHDIPCIADGGIKYSGDIVKALAVGADSVMLGSMLSGLEESPGELILYEGRRYKVYRGMGSLGAMQGHGADRYASAIADNTRSERDKLVPEGVEGQVPYKGKLADVVFQMMGGLRSGMGYVGARNLAELREKAQFVRITNAGLRESHPHGVLITKEAPNYQVRN